MTAAGRERWVLATGNPGKLSEFRELLGDSPIELVSLGELIAGKGPDETAPTFVENALIKARDATIRTGLPAIADDSGLVVDALGGRPGLHSARYAGPEASDAANLALLLDELGDRTGEARRAHYYAVVVALRSVSDPVPVIAEGVWSGLIASQPAGRNGFGYDPVFVDPDSGRTAAELAPETKNAVSHRARAVAGLKRRLGWA